MTDDCVFFVAEAADEGMRLDAFITGEMSDMSRSAVQKLIGEGRARVNNAQARSSCRLKPGDAVLFRLPEPSPLEIVPENIPLDIMYEDAELLVVNKAQGTVVHPAAGHCTGTLVNALLYHCGGSLSGINGVLRPGIVHRIDKDTSGALVIAKSNAAHQHLAKQLAEHTVLREYSALARGNPAQDTFTVDRPIGRHPTDRKRMWVNLRNGKQAVTHITVAERFKSCAYIKARLETGRTHQIRVHMAYLGHPLLGDTVYGAEKQKTLSGQALHASRLGFIHPNGEYMEFESALPDYFKCWLGGAGRAK